MAGRQLRTVTAIAAPQARMACASWPSQHQYEQQVAQTGSDPTRQSRWHAQHVTSCWPVRPRPTIVFPHQQEPGEVDGLFVRAILLGA